MTKTGTLFLSMPLLFVSLLACVDPNKPPVQPPQPQEPSAQRCTDPKFPQAAVYKSSYLCVSNTFAQFLACAELDKLDEIIADGDAQLGGGAQGGYAGVTVGINLETKSVLKTTTKYNDQKRLECQKQYDDALKQSQVNPFKGGWKGEWTGTEANGKKYAGTLTLTVASNGKTEGQITGHPESAPSTNFPGVIKGTLEATGGFDGEYQYPILMSTPLGINGSLTMSDDSKTARGHLRAPTNQTQQQLPDSFVGSSRVDLQACKLEYSIVSPK